MTQFSTIQISVASTTWRAKKKESTPAAAARARPKASAPRVRRNHTRDIHTIQTIRGSAPPWHRTGHRPGGPATGRKGGSQTVGFGPAQEHDSEGLLGNQQRRRPVDSGQVTQVWARAGRSTPPPPSPPSPRLSRNRCGPGPGPPTPCRAAVGCARRRAGHEGAPPRVASAPGPAAAVVAASSSAAARRAASSCIRCLRPAGVQSRPQGPWSVCGLRSGKIRRTVLDLHAT